MKSAAKRDNYCELQDILSSNNLNANSGFGYSWSHVRLRVDNYNSKNNRHRLHVCWHLGFRIFAIVHMVKCGLKKILFL